MSGKCRPSLRKKCLMVVGQSDFSQAVKECIAEVFARFEKANAEWKINPDGWYPYCSNCGAEPKNGVMSNFCPECGADMRGEKR